MENETSTTTQPNRLHRYFRWGKDGALMGIGYMLSPLSWWNDLFFNLPIAYGFGYVVRWFMPDWFLPATVVGYWLSNVLGIVIMQFAATDFLFEARSPNLRRDLIISFGTSTAYTLLVVALIYFHVIETPLLFSQQAD